MHEPAKLSKTQSLKSRAAAAVQNRDWKEAETMYRQLIALLEYAFGSLHLDIAMAAHALAGILEQQGNHKEAVYWRERTSEILLELDR